MSTIFANKIKNNQGGNNVKVNQLSGIDTAGSISVQGEGAATTSQLFNPSALHRSAMNLHPSCNLSSALSGSNIIPPVLH